MGVSSPNIIEALCDKTQHLVIGGYIRTISVILVVNPQEPIKFISSCPKGTIVQHRKYCAYLFYIPLQTLFILQRI